MNYFSSVLRYPTINPEVLFYSGHNIHFYDMEINALKSHHIQFLILKADNYVNYHSNNNGRNLRVNGVYGKARSKL